MDIDKANARLEKVKLRNKNNKLYMRATLPCKPWEGTGFKQYELRTGCNNTVKGIKTAFAKAQKLESDLLLEKFQWSDWVDLEIAHLQGRPIEHWVKEFETDYWHRNKQTPNSLESYRQNYTRYFNYLPPDELLTKEKLIETLVKFPPESAYRATAFVAYSALAKFVGVEVDLSRYKGKYKPSDRIVPTDSEIVEVYNQIANPGHKWVFGMLACYGLRPHELFYLDTSEQNRLPYLIRISEQTKTGSRVVYPVPAEWIQEWKLWELPAPRWKIENLDSTCNVALGRRISRLFWSKPWGFSAYALRDAYAIRCAVLGVDSTIASRWMGHTITVHTKHYQKYINELHFERIWLGKVLGKSKEEE